jgi:hypothetical protein
MVATTAPFETGTNAIAKGAPMSPRRRAAAASALLAPLLIIPLTGPASPAGAAAGGGPLASSIAVDWQRTAARTIYTERGSAPPLGALYLSFTSLAVHDAATEAQRQGSHAAAAAVAVAAHHVLRHYFSASGDALDADLDSSLAMVPDGKKEDAWYAIGAAAAAAMILSREHDGRGDMSIVYDKDPGLGIWQPAEGGAMALPWLGFVDPVVDDVEPVTLDGPDDILSPEYAQEYEEVRTLGPLNGSTRTPDQTAIARFFSNNPVLMYRNATCDLLDAEPLGLLPTTRLFAQIDAAVATTLIETWRLKYEIGFWRPFEAIAKGGDDGNGGTNVHEGPGPWVPLIPNPAYSDYTSGHAGGTSPFAEVMRRTLGDDTPLVLKAGDLQRSYATLSDLEDDALNARVWGGLHFRDAMDDGYHLGHTTAVQVMREIR